eukprot:69922-Pleurochrysis_carterae.AAC.2
MNPPQLTWRRHMDDKNQARSCRPRRHWHILSAQTESMRLRMWLHVHTCRRRNTANSAAPALCPSRIWCLAADSEASDTSEITASIE